MASSLPCERRPQSALWGRLWPYIDLDELTKYAGGSIQPYVIRQDPGDLHGYVRVLPTVQSKSAMHIGYAVLWFGLAVGALAVYVAMALARVDRRVPETR